MCGSLEFVSAGTWIENDHLSSRIFCERTIFQIPSADSLRKFETRIELGKDIETLERNRN